MAAVQLAMSWSNRVDLSDLDTDQQEQAVVGNAFDIVFSPTGSAVDVTGWSLAALIAPDVDSAPAKQWTDASFNTKTSGGLFTLSAITADTSSLPGRSYFVQVRRIDSGLSRVIAKGFLTLSPSPEYTPTTLPTTILRTSLGGTGADLSASGPGVLIQATAGANVTDLTGDLTNSTYYLRKDLTWGIPAGLSGAGTVTSVAVATANGISGTVATATTTPTITLTLGAITPSSIAASGTISGSNLSGTNTGDQTNISGNAATVSVIDAGADTTCWLLFANSQTGNLSPATNANATFNAATGVVSLVSPAFSGTPTAPTATLGTNTTQIATTAFVLANASTGTPTAITVANEATDTTCFPGFFTAATGDLGPKTNAALTFNANTANLGCTTFTGALIGNASTATLATNATNSAITNDTTTNATTYPTWVTTTTGNLPLKMSSTKFTFNPSTGNVTATTFTGALVGNADTATLAGTVSTNANLTGPITSVGNATSIASQTGTGTTFAMSAGPTFTGVPAAPTASPGTNTTQLATTAFVAAAVTAGVPTTITVANEATDTTCFPLFATAATGDLGPKSNAALTFNSNTVNLGCTTFTGALAGNATTATTLATSRNLWGQAFTGAADVTGSLTAVADITGGASSMTITAGTGASRTLVLKTTTSGSTATTSLTLAADQSATFANTVNATTFVGALTGNASTASAVAVSGITGLGTGVATALAVNVGSAGAFVTFNGAGGTPSSITLTNGSGTAASLTAGAVTGLTLASGSITLSGGHGITLTTTGTTSVTLPTSGTLATLAGTETFSGKTLTTPKFANAGYIADANGNEEIIFTTTASAVNQVTLANAATSGLPSLKASGDDTNISLLLAGQAAGRVRVADGTDNTKYVAWSQSGSTTATSLIIVNSRTQSRSWTIPDADDTFVGKLTVDTLANKTMTAQKIVDADGIYDENGNLQIKFSTTASAVNYITVKNAATGTSPIFKIAGGDGAGVNLDLAAAASGKVRLVDGSDNTKRIAFDQSGATTAKTATIVSSHTNDRTITLPNATDTLAGKATPDAFTNKTLIDSTNVTEEVSSTASSATPTPTGGSVKNRFTLTALAANVTFQIPSGTPVDGNRLLICVIPDATPRTVAFDTGAGGYRWLVTAPTTTVASKIMLLAGYYSSAVSKWLMSGYVQES